MRSLSDDAEEVTLTGWIIIPPEELAWIRPLLEEHIGLTRAEPGCLAFAVTPDPADASRFTVAERFRSRATFEAHQRRTAASTWGAATRHLERHYWIGTGERDFDAPADAKQA